MRKLALALAASAGLLASPTLAQAVPDPFPLGEIEIGLTIIPFAAIDIVTVETREIDGHAVVSIQLDPRLDPLIADATRDRIGWPVKLNLCGRQMIDARIQEPLVAAAFMVTFPDPEQALAVAQDFRNPPCAATLS